MKNKEIFMKMILVIVLLSGGYYFFIYNHNDIQEYTTEELSIQHQFLTVNPYSRPGKTLKRINGIVVHYTANPGSSAQNNRDYFENLKNRHTTKVSSHFIIGIDGEIIQCIPSDHHGLRVVFSNNKNNRKPTYTWKLNNSLLNDNLVRKERKKERN